MSGIRKVLLRNLPEITESFKFPILNTSPHFNFWLNPIYSGEVILGLFTCILIH